MYHGTNQPPISHINCIIMYICHVMKLFQGAGSGGETASQPYFSHARKENGKNWLARLNTTGSRDWISNKVYREGLGETRLAIYSLCVRLYSEFFRCGFCTEVSRGY